jgi:hypothetical protein
MSPTTKKQIGRYAAALGIFVIALAARLLLDLIVPWRLPFITFFPAVFLAAYYLGSGPGVLVLALSTVAGTAGSIHPGIVRSASMQRVPCYSSSLLE